MTCNRSRNNTKNFICNVTESGRDLVREHFFFGLRSGSGNGLLRARSIDPIPE